MVNNKEKNENMPSLENLENKLKSSLPTEPITNNCKTKIIKHNNFYKSLFIDVVIAFIIAFSIWYAIYLQRKPRYNRDPAKKYFYEILGNFSKENSKTVTKKDIKIIIEKINQFKEYYPKSKYNIVLEKFKESVISQNN